MNNFNIKNEEALALFSEYVEKVGINNLLKEENLLNFIKLIRIVNVPGLIFQLSKEDSTIEITAQIGSLFDQFVLFDYFEKI